MRSLNEYIITLNESELGNLRPISKEELKELIRRRMNEQGPKCNLNDIDVSGVKDMSALFEGTDFNGDISGWNVSKVKDMSDMFKRSPLSGKEPSWYRG